MAGIWHHIQRYQFNPSIVIESRLLQTPTNAILITHEAKYIPLPACNTAPRKDEIPRIHALPPSAVGFGCIIETLRTEVQTMSQTTKGTIIVRAGKPIGVKTDLNPAL